MSVSVRDLSKVYGAQKAVEKVSFEVQPGQILGFLGPNGAGKSTTMKMITGYIPPSEGQITVRGTDMLSHPLEGRRYIGYLPEHNPLYHDMYVREYLHFVAGIYRLDKRPEAVSRVIEMTGLGKEQHKLIRQLSKGYKQRVGLAQALIHDPEVLILDEPTTGLDPNQLSEIRSLIRELGRSKTIIFSTHIMQEVQAVCDRVMIIQSGKIVADDTVKGLTGKLSGNAVVHISFEQPIPVEHFREQPAIESIAPTGPMTYQVTGKDLLELKRALFEIAVRHHNPILSLQDQQTNLEDLFKQLTS